MPEKRLPEGKDIMTFVLITGWFVLIGLSYKVAEVLLKKSGSL